MTLFRDRLEVHRAPLAAGKTARVRDWGSAVLLFTGWGSIQPDGGPRRTVDRESSPGEARAYLPPGVDLKVADRVLCAGQWYEVTEVPEVWSTGASAHVRAVVRRVANG